MIDILLRKFIIFFSVIDPIGTIPVFIAVTAGYNAQYQKKIALKAIFKELEQSRSFALSKTITLHPTTRFGF